jgi:hypothetical protein
MDDIKKALAEILADIDYRGGAASQDALAEEILAQLQYKGLKIVPVDDA